MANYLVIFDFDNTLIDGNTDSVILDLVPGLREASAEYKYRDKGWGEVMNNALNSIWQQRLQRKDIDECILSLKLTEIVKQMILSLSEKKMIDVIIVSHSNEYFIDTLLKDVGIESSVFKGVFSYPAEWKENGNLEVKRFHHEIVNCNFCPNDFCKGKFLSKFIKETEEDKSQKYSRKIYVGDGRADYCASEILSGDDHILCRHGFALHKLIMENREKSNCLEESCDFPMYTCWHSFDELKESLDKTLGTV